MVRPKTYIIQLTDKEPTLLDKTIRNKKTCKTVLKRCQILRGLDEVKGTGLTHQQIAHTYVVCPATISNITRVYPAKGIDEVIRYNSSPNSSAALRKADGRAEARLLQIACGSVPEGHARWTIRRLEERSRIELETPFSSEIIHRVLKNELRPHLNDDWCIPPKENAEFLACMEDILGVYEMPYNPQLLVVCMDENLISYWANSRIRSLCVRDTLKTDSEYIHNGTCFRTCNHNICMVMVIRHRIQSGFSCNRGILRGTDKMDSGKKCT